MPLGGEVRGDEVCKRAALAHVVENAGRLARQVRHEREEVTHPFAQTRAERVELRVAFEILRDPAHARAHERLEHRVLRDLKAREPVEDHGVVARPEAQHLDDTRDGADFIEVLEARLVDLGVALAHDADDGALVAREVLDEAHAARTPDVDGHDAGGEDDAVPERQDGEKLCVGWRTKVAHCR
jgi:hypothetical protein